MTDRKAIGTGAVTSPAATAGSRSVTSGGGQIAGNGGSIRSGDESVRQSLMGERDIAPDTHASCGHGPSRSIRGNATDDGPGPV